MAKWLKNTPVSGPTDSDWELKGIMDSLTYAQRDDLLKMLQEDKRERERPSFESLFWNEKAILEDIKKNYLTVTWDVTRDVHGFHEMVPLRWMVVKLDLPEVPGSDFKWFKIELFISGRVSYLDDVTDNDELCSKEKLEDIARAINGYMRAYWVALDENVDFNWDLEGVPCKTWEYVEDLLRLWGGWIKVKKTWYNYFTKKEEEYTTISDFYLWSENGWKRVSYQEVRFYDDPESDSIPPKNSLILLLSD